MQLSLFCDILNVLGVQSTLKHLEAVTIQFFYYVKQNNLNVVVWIFIIFLSVWVVM